MYSVYIGILNIHVESLAYLSCFDVAATLIQ